MRFHVAHVAGVAYVAEPRGAPDGDGEGAGLPAVTIDLATVRLDRGAHKSRDGTVGVMEAVAWFAGEPHTNHPETVSPVISAFCQLINDSVGDEERQRLVGYIPRLVDTKAAHDVELRRVMAIADWAVRVAAPAALRSAGLAETADDLSKLPAVTEAGSAQDAAKACANVQDAVAQAVERAARAARAAARATRATRTTEQARVAERERGNATVKEAARLATAAAAEAASGAASVWTAAPGAEAMARAVQVVEAAEATWAAAVHAAVQIPVEPVDWAAVLDRMLDVS